MKRKFFLPLFLIFFLLAILVFQRVRQLNLSFDFSLPGQQKIVSPLPIFDKEATLGQIFHQYGLLAQNLRVTGNEAVASISGIPVFLTLDKDLNSKVASLQLILSRAKIEGRLPRAIDLRFSKPVLSY